MNEQKLVELAREIEDTANSKDYVAPKEISSKEFLERIKEELPTTGKFTPYAYYNEPMDEIQVYFKDENCYTKPLNDQLELHLSFDTEEVVGVNVLGVKKLIQDKGKFK